MKKVFIGLVTAFAVLVTMSLPASAAILQAGDEYTLPAGEKLSDNLYVGAGMINISGDIAGDLIAGGGNITVTGNILNDAALGGGTVNVFGEIGDDLRVGGGSITVSKNVEGDLIATGGFVHILSEVVVGGDLVAAGGMIIVDGQVKGNANLSGGEINVNGKINGNIDAQVGEKFALGSQANVKGDISYKSATEALISEGAVIGGKINYKKIKKKVFPFKGFEKGAAAALIGVLTFFAFIKFLIVLLTGLLAVLILPKKSRELVELSIKKFGTELLLGLVILIVMPIALGILFVSVLGSVIAVLGGLVYAMFMVVGKIYAGIILGAVLYKWFAKSKKIEVSWKSALIGIFILSIVSWAPLVGWLIKLVFVLVGVGAAAHLCHKNFWLKR